MMKNLKMLLPILLIATLWADEGMWMPHQMKMLDLEKEGLLMSPDELYKSDGTGLMSAVVDLGGGTGSFVSEQGLIFTNHHVAYGAIQRASTPENNYLEEGFLAKNNEEEILAPGYTAGVLLSYEEVTDQIIAAVDSKMSPLEKYHAIDKAKKKLIAKTEEEAPDRYAEIAAMYSGNAYYLFKYKKIKDVRIVYAPPGSLGNFGGEIDNWMWPRHTCDFTFLRAYVSPEGIGTEYNENNVPYKPSVHLKIASKGVQEKDFTFIMGYPGRTYRNYSTPEVLYDIDRMKTSIEERLEHIKFFEEAGANNKEVEIKYASKVKGLYNGLKNYRGKLEGFEKINLIEKKKEADREFTEWVNDKRSRKKQYKDIIEKIENFIEKDYKDFISKEADLSELGHSYYGPALLGKAYTLVRIATEGQKPDSEREAYFQERNIPNIKRYMQFAERSYDKAVDKKYALLLMNKFITKNQGNLPSFIEDILKKDTDIESWLDKAYAKTQLDQTDFTLSLFGKTPKELEELGDPLIDFAFSLENELLQNRDKKYALSQELSDLKKIYKKALLEMNDNKIAPDANSTIRFTSGHIKGYEPRDGVYYKPITTIKGVIEKDTGEKPFDTPKKIKELYYSHDFGRYEDKQLKSVPACFLNTTNVTGGNSGSPTLNAKGEVAGIVFDMTYESVTGDYFIVPEMQRVISADIRYVLFVTDKFSEAKYLIQEMNIK